MAYERKFNAGRQSEQIYNEELHKIHESIKHLLETPEAGQIAPGAAKVNGALWLDLINNELNSYSNTRGWQNIFKDKFKITDQITSGWPPENPIHGQLWIDQDGVLRFFNGHDFIAIKALTQDSSDISLGMFENFLLLSPLHPPVGNEAIIDGEGIEKSQFLVPNSNIGKYFINDRLYNDYEKTNRVTILYPKEQLEGLTPSWSHVNPNKLISIKKRLFKVDGISHYVGIPTVNTEFYGFKSGSRSGHFLRPNVGVNIGDYEIRTDGLYLNSNLVDIDINTGERIYDYILAVTYEFSRIRSTGSLKKSDTDIKSLSFYVGGFDGPLNMFIEGYDLDSSFYSYDPATGIATVTDEDGEAEMEVNIIKSIKREYGIIKTVEYNDAEGYNEAIIKLRQEYIDPIVFVNGQALYQGNLEDFRVEIGIEEGFIYVKDAQRYMTYCVMELKNKEDEDSLLLQADYVVTNGYIEINNLLGRVDINNDALIVFIDGMLIKKEEAVIAEDLGVITITIAGLQEDQSYIVLHDKDNEFFYDETRLRMGLVTGKIDESLVFMNQHLICNSTALVTNKNEEDAAKEAFDREIKFFSIIPNEEIDPTNKEQFKMYNVYDKEWKPVDEDLIEEEKIIEDVIKISTSYRNELHSVSFNEEILYDSEDHFKVYAYNFADTIENPLFIFSELAEDKAIFNTPDFWPGRNSLQVFLDGIRQFEINETINSGVGVGFTLEDEYTGKVTYIIQHPESGAEMSCEREVLYHTDMVSPNVYQTNEISLYPGLVTVYVSGLRQPKDSYTIIDNKTIAFKDTNIILLGDEESILKDGAIEIVPVNTPDTILIEVRQDFKRKETTFPLEGDDLHIFIDNYPEIPTSILESQDEILIFINGTFPGLKNNLGYIKDLNQNAIVITNQSYRGIENKIITLEWR